MKPVIKRKQNKSVRDKSSTFKENSFKGSGLYLFKNHKKSELILPKPTKDGINNIQSGQTWEGDDYYFCLVRSNLAQLVRQVKSPEELEKIKEENIMEEKLILEQDPFVTEEGTIEHVVVNQETQLQETNVKKGGRPKKDKKVLITDKIDSGIEIF
jgi:hypothetical protein